MIRSFNRLAAFGTLILATACGMEEVDYRHSTADAPAPRDFNEPTAPEAHPADEPTAPTTPRNPTVPRTPQAPTPPADDPEVTPPTDEPEQPEDGPILTPDCDEPEARQENKANLLEAIETGEAPESVAVGLYIEGHPSIDNQDMLESCAFWPGVSCFETNAAEADVTVVVNADPCVPQDDGRVVLATHWVPDLACGPHVITMYSACIYRGAFDAETSVCSYDDVSGVFAHEIGHGLGMGHIPEQCDGSNPNPILSDDQGDICGDGAVMNPFQNWELNEAQPLDLRFIAHRWDGSLLPTGNEADEPAIRWLLGMEDSLTVDERAAYASLQAVSNCTYQRR